MKKRGLVVLLVLFLSSLFLANGVLIPPNPMRPNVGGFSMNYHNVAITVEGGVARVKIEEEFQNVSNARLEAVYLFPIPGAAVISDFVMKVGDQVLKGEVLPADEARKIYQEIVAKLKDPALLEYVGSRLIRLSVFPFEAGEKRQFFIEYTQPLEVSSNAYAMTYPLKIDRFLTAPINKVNVRINTGEEVSEVFSPSHQLVEVKKSSGREYVFQAENFTPNSDLIMVFTASSQEIPSSILTHRDPETGESYFLLTLIPRLKEEKIIPKDVVFVLDISGSMYGEKIEQAKKALEQVLQMLRTEDRFAIVTFDDKVYKLTGGLISAKEKSEWIEKVRTIESGGSTNIYDALQRGIDLFGRDENRFKTLLFLTDGEPTAGITDTGKIVNAATLKARARNIHLFSFGVGTGVVAEILDRLVQENAGRVSYIVEGETIEGKVTELYRSIETPALENVTISLEGVNTAKVLPEGPHSLFSGYALRISGIFYDGGELKVSLEGTRAGQKYAYEYYFRLGETLENDFVARIWAQKRVAFLANEYRYDQNLSEKMKEEVVQEIVALSKKFNIINEFTSFLIAPERLKESDTFGDRGGYNAPQAAGSVMAAKSVAELEQNQLSQDKNTDYKFLEGVGFYLKDGVWIQDDPRIEKSEPVKVMIFSEAYFGLMDINQWVKDVLSLGEKLIFSYGDTFFEIGEEGLTTLIELEPHLK